MSKALMKDVAELTDCTAIPSLSEGGGQAHLSVVLAQLLARYHQPLLHAPTKELFCNFFNYYVFRNKGPPTSLLDCGTLINAPPLYAPEMWNHLISFVHPDSTDLVVDDTKSGKKGASKALYSRSLQPPVRIQQIQLNALYVSLRLMDALQGFAGQTDAFARGSVDFFATPADGVTQRYLVTEIIAHVVYKALEAKKPPYTEAKTSWIAAKNPNLPALKKRGRKTAAEPPGPGLAPLPDSVKSHIGIEKLVSDVFESIGKRPLHSFDALVVALVTQVGSTCAGLVQGAAEGAEKVDIQAWLESVRELRWGPYSCRNNNEVCPREVFYPWVTDLMLSFGKPDPTSGQPLVDGEGDDGSGGEGGGSIQADDIGGDNEDGRPPEPGAQAPQPVVAVVNNGSIAHGTLWATNGSGQAAGKKGAGPPAAFPLRPNVWEDPANVAAGLVAERLAVIDLPPWRTAGGRPPAHYFYGSELAVEGARRAVEGYGAGVSLWFFRSTDLSKYLPLLTFLPGTSTTAGPSSHTLAAILTRRKGPWTVLAAESEDDLSLPDGSLSTTCVVMVSQRVEPATVVKTMPRQWTVPTGGMEEPGANHSFLHPLFVCGCVGVHEGTCRAFVGFVLRGLSETLNQASLTTQRCSTKRVLCLSGNAASIVAQVGE